MPTTRRKRGDIFRVGRMWHHECRPEMARRLTVECNVVIVRVMDPNDLRTVVLLDDANRRSCGGGIATRSDAGATTD